MLNEWLAPGLLAAAVALLLFPLLVMMFRKRDVETPIGDDDDDDRPVLGGMTAPLAEQIPLSPTGRSDIHRLLLAAGYYHRTALSDFQAIRAILTVVPLLVAGAIALMVEQPYVGRTVIGGVVGALLGFSLPRAFVALRARNRGIAMARGLPLAIDLFTLCVTAGQNLLSALGQVSKELQYSHPVLAQELAIVQRQAELHSLEVALQQWSDRVQVPEVSNFALLLIQSQRLGTDTAATMTELADNFRATSRQRAEAQANRTSFWMLFPSVFCFWVAAAIMLLGPAYMEVFDYRQRDAQRRNEETRKSLERANRGRTPRPVAE